MSSLDYNYTSNVMHKVLIKNLIILLPMCYIHYISLKKVVYWPISKIVKLRCFNFPIHRKKIH